MKMIFFVALALFPQLVLSQQAQSDPNQSWIIRIVKIQHANPERIVGLVSHGMPVRAEADTTLRVILLKGTPRDVAAVEQAIHELDLPEAAAAPVSSAPKDIELVVSVIGGSSNAAISEDLIPGDNAAVIKQLRAVFPYKHYQTLSSMLLLSRTGTKAENKGIMKSLAQFDAHPRPTAYSILYDNVTATSEEGKPMIHLHNFRFFSRIPIVLASQKNAEGKEVVTQTEDIDVAVASDIDLREGQKIVVGKANVDSDDSALFVVLTARQVN